MDLGRWVDGCKYSGIVFLALLLSSSFVCAIGVSPPSVQAHHVLRGSSVESEIILSGVAAGQDVLIQTKGEIADWLSTEQGLRFSYPDVPQYPLQLIITLPDDVPNGEYFGSVIFSTLASSDVSTGASATMRPGVELEVVVEVTGEQVMSYSVSALRIGETEYGSALPIILAARNDGNVALSLDLSVELMSMDDDVSLSTVELSPQSPLAPGEVGELLYLLDHGLDPGEYRIRLTVLDDERRSELLYLSVLEKGALLKSASILAVHVPAQLGLGSPLRIESLVRNDGELPFDLVLVSEIWHDQDLVAVLRSDPLSLGVGDQGSVLNYYEPEVTGLFVVKSYLSYAGKRSELAESVFRVGDVAVAEQAASLSLPVASIWLQVLIVASLTVFIGFLLSRRRRR